MGFEVAYDRISTRVQIKERVKQLIHAALDNNLIPVGEPTVMAEDMVVADRQVRLMSEAECMLEFGLRGF